MNDLIREIAQLIESTSGFVVSEQGYPTLQTFIIQRVEQGGFSGVERYADYLRRHPDSEEWRHILSKITIKESYLFRAQAQFDALSNTVFNEISARRSRLSPLQWKSASTLRSSMLEDWMTSFGTCPKSTHSIS